MNPYETLLVPISAEHPCGPDISMEPSFLELDRLVEGKPETQFSEAVPPDWSKVHERCLQLLTLSKHLQPAACLCLASLHLRGLEGLADGTDFLASLIETFWDTIYPLPDADDAGNPVERMNILGAFNVPMGSFGDPFRFLECLRECPVSNSPLLGKFSLQNWEDAQREEGKTSSPEVPHIEAALRDTPKDWLRAQLLASQRAKNAFTRMAQFLNALPQSDSLVPDFSLPLHVLADLEKMLIPFVNTPAPAEEVDPATGATAGPAAPPAARPSGKVQSREDVIKLLDVICDYYQRQEPASPVPLLLQRAKGLVELDFLGVIEDLAPDALKAMQQLAGKKS